MIESLLDMESDEMLSERQSIRDSARQLKKYGSTCNHVRNNEYLIRHNLEQTDTLQGIALKYGCTTEQIRRANRLFTQDGLFLRQFLMIPFDRDTSMQHNQLTKTMSLPVNSHTEKHFNSPTTSISTTVGGVDHVDSATSSSMHDKKHTILSPEEENKKSMEDFLGKIDSTLAKTKNYVKNSQSSLNGTLIPDNNDEDGLHSAPAYGCTRSYQNSTGTSNISNNSVSQTVVMRDKRVKSSLHRLEEQQDEFYQL